MAANVRLRGTTFHFRRRVPTALRESFGRSEIVLSLGTRSPREAAVRARIMYVETERVFRTVSNTPSLAAEQVAIILKRLRTEPTWDSPTRAELLDGFKTGDMATIDRLLGIGAEAIMTLPPGDRQQVIEHLERLLDGVAVDTADAATTAARLETSVAKIRAVSADARAKQAERRADLAEAAEVVRSARPAPAGRVVAATETPTRRSPKFSKHEQAFLRWKNKHSGWSAHTCRQAETTFRLLKEIIGDKAVRDYSPEDAGTFYDTLLRLPKTHGKGAARGKAIPALEAIARADAVEATGKAVPRMLLKTVKRHFSAVLQYWRWMKPRGYISELIWSGFDFPGTKSSKKSRDEWSEEDLRKLFQSKWWTANAPRDTAQWWVPLIALHSGMRLEEICRLRPEDVVTLYGVPCFNLREHPDGWSPKTEAGERLVPVHPFLVELGLLALVERRRSEGAARVFPELRSKGDDQSLGQALGRSFGRLKTSLGVGPKTVFHSFRHTFRTELESAELQERWIDAVMGHEDPKRSEGARSYAKRVAVRRLNEVVCAFKAPVDLSHLVAREG